MYEIVEEYIQDLLNQGNSDQKTNFLIENVSIESENTFMCGICVFSIVNAVDLRHSRYFTNLFQECAILFLAFIIRLVGQTNPC